MSDPPYPPISAMMARRLAHAMRTPLSVIDGALSELSTSSDPAVARFAEYAVIGRRSVLQLVELTYRLEWAGRVQRVAEEPLKVIQWPDVIRRCVDARVERQGRSRKPVDLSIADGVGEGLARSEASERVLSELLDNALRHARTAVRVTAEVDSQTLVVRVADDGPGLPGGGVDPFAPPQQVGPRVGFGLWLAERLTTALQGSVGVERTGEEGTVMCLRLPLQGSA